MSTWSMRGSYKRPLIFPIIIFLQSNTRFVTNRKTTHFFMVKKIYIVVVCAIKNFYWLNYLRFIIDFLPKTKFFKNFLCSFWYRCCSKITFNLSLFAILITAIITINETFSISRETLFNESVVIDRMSSLMKIITLIGGFLVLIISSSYLKTFKIYIFQN